MDFRSDNVAGAHPAVLEALVAASRGSTSSYGADPWTARVELRLSEIFERECSVLPVATGTAANALALSLYTPPWGAVYCHEGAHVHGSECGAPEFFSAGAKLVPVHGEHGKLTPSGLESALTGAGHVHAVQPAALSLSQATEAGTVYDLDQLAALSELSRRHRLALHMDGARFANALVSLDVTPAQLTWRSGVDVLSFGATKNGCLAAEAVILFAPEKAGELAFRRKRAGHLLSKMRLISAQLEAYLARDLWLDNARHANALAERLALGLASLGFAPCTPVQANELFVSLPSAGADRLRQRGFAFLDWPLLGADVRRFVTSFETQASDVDALLETVRTDLLR